MKRIKDNVDEIDEFISKLRFKSPLGAADNNKAFAGCYKYIHALLLWESLLSSLPKEKVNPDSMLHFREFLADVSASQALVLTGLYKPARMMLRSSIENLLRVAALEQGFLVAGAKFTHELISLVRSSKIGAKGSPVASDLDSIIASYSALCAYTHASAPKFLSLKIPLASLNTFEKKEFLDIIDLTRELSLRYSRVSFAIYHSILSLAHHKHRDYILDALPKGLKAQIYE